MKTYDLIQRQTLHINMKTLVDDVIDCLAADYEPEDYDQIDDIDVNEAIECAIDYQETVRLCSEYDNWNDILEEITNDIANYINSHDIQEDLIPIIKNKIYRRTGQCH